MKTSERRTVLMKQIYELADTLCPNPTQAQRDDMDARINAIRDYLYGLTEEQAARLRPAHPRRQRRPGRAAVSAS